MAKLRFTKIDVDVLLQLLSHAYAVEYLPRSL